MTNYKLNPMYTRQKSFYGKAVVNVHPNGEKVLISYSTAVARIVNGQPVVKGTYSQTTLRHIKEFLQQHGFKAINKAQIEADYMTA